MPPVPLPADLVARFMHDTLALAPGMDRLGVAVSGGPDSLALLLLAQAAFPGRIAAASVDHGLRPEGRSEALFVAETCANRGIPHRLLTVEVDTAPASLQQSARRARYAALGTWLEGERIDLLATAHHLDDRAETLLMRLVRGAGVSGLAGVRASAPLPVPGAAARLIRPLLHWRRDELRAIVDAAGLTAVDDPSNRDPRYDRSRIRMRLAGESWLDPAALARSAAALADAEDALRWTADSLYEARVRREGPAFRFAHDGVPRELKRRIVLAVIAALVPEAQAPRGDAMERLLLRLERGGVATLAGIKCRGGLEWVFERAPPRARGT